jgi:DNA modification methylase
MSAKKQEFLNGRIVLYNGDCLDVMRDLKDKEIDLVLTSIYNRCKMKLLLI